MVWSSPWWPCLHGSRKSRGEIDKRFDHSRVGQEMAHGMISLNLLLYIKWSSEKVNGENCLAKSISRNHCLLQIMWDQKVKFLYFQLTESEVSQKNFFALSNAANFCEIPRLYLNFNKVLAGKLTVTMLLIIFLFSQQLGDTITLMITVA